MAKGIYVGVKDEYKVLDYIQSSGTQYIDFGFPITTKTFKVQMQAMYFSSSTNEQPLISIWTSSYNYWNVFVNASNQMSFYYNAHLNGSTISFNSVLNLEFGTDESGTYGYAGKRWVSVNGSVSSTSTSLLNTNNTTLKLFTRGDLNGKTSGRVYYVKQYNGTSLVHDIVPVKRVSDGLVGMYDKTTKKFHKNSGTGVFTYGAETGETINGDSVSRKVKSAYISVPLPDGYQQVEYIQSTGTQYIDTGVIATQNTGFEIGFYSLNSLSSEASQYGSIFGARTGSASNELQLTSYLHSSSYGGTLRFGTNNYDAGFACGAKMKASLKSCVYTSNNGTKTTLSSTAFTSPVNITVFALNNNGEITQHGKVRIYYFRLYNGKSIVRDFVPCYRKSDNVVGLYDLVNNVFYTNKGTGSFTVGNTSNPFARKVVKAYIGSDSGIAKQFWPPFPTFNFGDGSLNATSGGYNGKLYFTNLSTDVDTAFVSGCSYAGTYTAINGNITSASPNWQGTALHTAYSSSHSRAVINAGTNTYTTTSVTGTGKFSCNVEMIYSSLGYGITLNTFKLRLDGTLYSLKDAVSAKKIEPLVLIYSPSSSSSYTFSSPTNLYANSGSSTGNYANFIIQFIPKEGVVFNGISVYASAASTTQYNDGYGVYKRDNIIFHLGRQ